MLGPDRADQARRDAPSAVPASAGMKPDHDAPADLDEAAAGRTLLRAIRRAQLAGVAVVGLGALAVERALWAAGAGAVAAVVLTRLAAFAGENRDPATGRLHPDLGLPTTVTLLRAAQIAALAGFLLAPASLAPWPALAGVLYLGAALLDRLDGYLARTTGRVTALGERLDVELDALGLLVAPALAVRLGRLPPWYLALGLAYYAFRALLALRRRLGLPDHEDRIPWSSHGRVFAGFQMGLVAVALFPLLSPSILAVASTVFMTPVLASFARDYLVVVGMLVPGTPAYRRQMARAAARIGQDLPAGLRVAGAALVAWSLLGPAPGLPASPYFVVGLGAMILGAAGRVGALVTLVELGRAPFPSGSAGTVPTAVAALAAAILILGPGRCSAWKPEERWIFTRSGAPDDDGTARRPLLRALAAAGGLAVGAWALDQSGQLDQLGQIGQDGHIGQFGQAPWSRVLAAASTIEPAALAAAAAANGVLLLLWNLRGLTVARGLGIAVGAGRFFALRLAGFAVGYVAPGPPVAGEPLVVLRLAPGPGAARVNAARAILWDRLVEAAVSGPILAVLGVLIAGHLGPDRLAAAASDRPGWSIGAAALLAALALAAGARLAGPQLRVLGKPPPAGVLARAVALGLAGWLSAWAEYVLAWRIFGARVDPGVAWVGLGLARLAFVLPVPGGLGVLEASQVLFAELAGLDVALALAVVTWMRARDLATVALGGLLGALVE